MAFAVSGSRLFASSNFVLFNVYLVRYGLFFGFILFGYPRAVVVWLGIVKFPYVEVEICWFWDEKFRHFFQSGGVFASLRAVECVGAQRWTLSCRKQRELRNRFVHSMAVNVLVQQVECVSEGSLAMEDGSFVGWCWGDRKLSSRWVCSCIYMRVRACAEERESVCFSGVALLVCVSSSSSSSSFLEECGW